MKILTILTLFLHISLPSNSQTIAELSPIPINKSTGYAEYTHIDSSIFKLPEITQYARKWVSQYWNYKRAVSFESDDQIELSSASQLPDNKGFIRCKIFIDLKDNKYRLRISEITYSEIQSSKITPIEGCIFQYFSSMSYLKRNISEMTESERSQFNKEKDGHEFRYNRYDLAFKMINNLFDEMAKELHRYVNTKPDW